jgi:formylglycine-generating enzyme required for sulfatase activity
MPNTPRSLLRALLIASAVAALAAPAAAQAAKRAVITVPITQIGQPGNPAAAITPFTDAIYQSCSSAPASPPCQTVGSVGYPYGIGKLEVTVSQYVAFLNTADPTGRNRHNLWSSNESSSAWPKYGQINLKATAPPGRRYRIAYPEWADKPYGFANFLRTARFANSLSNGQVLRKTPVSQNGFSYVIYKVRLSPKTEHGMYDLRKPKTTRRRATGFVVPSQDEWIKAAYFDPTGGGMFSYWKYPTNPGNFFDQPTQLSPDPTAPNTATLNSSNGDVTNSSTQPLSIYHGSSFPSWCPSQVSQSDCDSVNPLHLKASTYQKAYQGSVGTVGQAKTLSPWGTLDQGGNAVEWTDTITPPPAGKKGARVWRRLHGGVPNAPAYQLWLSAIGLQPQDNKFYNAVYPWLGFRVGVVGDLKVKKG